MTLLLGVLLASLAGSVHCAAMCGAFVCAYAVPRGPGSRPGAQAHVAYHGGRLVSYLVLGALAGSLGSGLNQMAALAGIGRGAAIVAGVVMSAWAVTELARLLGFRVPTGPAAAPTALLARVLSGQREQSAVRRALTLGLVTTLIPCGWLYAFVATAAATGSMLGGVAVMTVFWTGTVPALVAVAVGAARAFRGPARRWPVAAVLAVLVLGLLTISGRIQPLQPITHAGAHAGH